MGVSEKGLCTYYQIPYLQEFWISAHIVQKSAHITKILQKQLINVKISAGDGNILGKIQNSYTVTKSKLFFRWISFYFYVYAPMLSGGLNILIIVLSWLFLLRFG